MGGQPSCNLYYEDLKEDLSQVHINVPVFVLGAERLVCLCKSCGIEPGLHPRRPCNLYLEDLRANPNLTEIRVITQILLCRSCHKPIGSHPKQPRLRYVNHVSLLKGMLKKRGVPVEDLTFETKTDTFPFSVAVRCKDGSSPGKYGDPFLGWFDWTTKFVGSDNVHYLSNEAIEKKSKEECPLPSRPLAKTW